MTCPEPDRPLGPDAAAARAAAMRAYAQAAVARNSLVRQADEALRRAYARPQQGPSARPTGRD